MINTKTYASKAGAKKAAKRQGLDVEKLTFQENHEDRWYWEAAFVAEPVVEEELTKIVMKGTGIKIEKDRPEANGVIRPSVGGKCYAIWATCDELKEKGIMPMPKVIREWAKEMGVNENNAIIEMYQWRKFHGIVGRQK